MIFVVSPDSVFTGNKTLSKHWAEELWSFVGQETGDLIWAIGLGFYRIRQQQIS